MSDKLSSIVVPSLENEPNSSFITPFSFDNLPVRGFLLKLKNIHKNIPSLSQERSKISASLAEMLASSVILTSDLKYKADVTLQIQSESDVPVLIAQCSHNGNIRAYAHQEEDKKTQKDISFSELRKKKGIFSINVKNISSKNDTSVYQSIVALQGKSVAESVEAYFNDSVQLNTHLKIFTDISHNGLSCYAVFLQMLPDSEPSSHLDDWKRLKVFVSTLNVGEISELSGNDILYRLFSEKDTVRISKDKPLIFSTPNAREHMLEALRKLGHKECKNLLEDGKITIKNEFTGEEEVFSEGEIKSLF